jgi:2-dehydro-3-deoxygluconokinase
LKKIITFGEVLLRLSTKEYLRFSQATDFNADYGGSELNVATSLVKFGMNAEFVSRVPDNDIGKCAISEMRKNDVSTNFMVTGGERLGIYFIEKGASVRGSKVVYDRAYSSFSSIKKGMINWEDVFQNANWFHWSGITPGISQDAADVCLEAIEVANRLGLTISTDFNYRANLWNYGKSPGEIMEKMVSLCDIILAGDYASKQYFGIEPDGNSETELNISLCKKLMERFPYAKKIAVTNRVDLNASQNKWSAILYDGATLHQSKTYDITYIVDRIGTGDSFMGALIYGLNHFEDQKALDFAVAASCLKHTIYGDTNLVTVDEVEKLLNGDGSGRVVR